MSWDLQTIVSHAKEYGFIFQSSEIYEGGLAAVYDYGPLGVQLKRNLNQLWWRAMVQLREDVVGLDTAILMHPMVWHASGHVEAFHDPLIDNKDSKKRYRADELIEQYAERYYERARKQALKMAKKRGWGEGSQEFLDYMYQTREWKKAEEIKGKLAKALEKHDLKALKSIIEEYEIGDPETGSRNWTDVRQFNLMFKTEVGPLADKEQVIYLRPETAQGIFVNFLNVQKTMRMKVPFGIAQIGKAFRNEIVARQFLFRMREFEQMEMQYFVKPGTQKNWFSYWQEARYKWHVEVGLKPENLRFKEHEHLAHYADAAVDIEFRFPFGFKEIEGIHSRTDFDLSRHQEYSGKKMTYFDIEVKEHYIPYVIETSAGLDRLVLAHLCQAYCEEEVPNAKGEKERRVVLSFPPLLAPIQVAVFPLVRRDGMPEIAHRIYEELKQHFYAFYEEKDTIGRRYRRQDAYGTPFCITIDQQTLEDGTVTVRFRDTLEQIRIHQEKLITQLREWISLNRVPVSLQNYL